MLRQPSRWSCLALLCCLGCKGQTPTPATQAPSQSPPPAAASSETITREQLANLSYPSELAPQGHVQLRDGVFEAQEALDTTAHVVVQLTPHVAEGDLNGDGRVDAAVILESDSGGSGSFMDLAAVLNTPEGPQTVATIDLGDRTEIRDLSIHDGIVRIELLGHGPQDPVCCPTQVQEREYRLDGTRWIANERRPPP